MNWKNLSKNRCPKCNKLLDFKSDKEMMMCTISCGFMISVKRMAEIVSESTSRELDRYRLQDNSEDWNNFGLPPKEDEDN